MEEKYLPIGSVVMLKNATKRLMIAGFCAIDEQNKEKMWDYSGCVYPEGFLTSNQTCLFDHDQIDTIYHLGLVDKEENEFKATLKELVAAAEKQKNQ